MRSISKQLLGLYLLLRALEIKKGHIPTISMQTKLYILELNINNNMLVLASYYWLCLYLKRSLLDLIERYLKEVCSTESRFTSIEI